MKPPTQAIILRNKGILAEKLVIADSFWVRLTGLMGRKRLENGEGMWFPRCSSVHMWFMKIPLDLVFLSKDREQYRVTSIRKNALPWSLLPFSDLKANIVLEIPSGTLDALEIREGDEVCLK